MLPALSARAPIRTPLTTSHFSTRIGRPSPLRADLIYSLRFLVLSMMEPARLVLGGAAESTPGTSIDGDLLRIVDARDVPNTPMALSGGPGVPRGCIRLYSVVPLSLEESAGTNLTYDHRVSSGMEEHDQRRPYGSTFASPPGQELRVAIVTCIERTHHGRRRQQRLCGLTPIEFATLHTTAQLAHGVTRSWVPLLAP